MSKSPSGWQVTTLGQTVNLRRDTVQPTDAAGLKYVGLEHLDSGDPQLKRWGTATEVTSTKNRFYPSDVLYGKLRPYLDKAVLVDSEGICSTDILVLQAHDAVLPDYLDYLLHTQSFIDHAVATTSGVNHPRTSWQALAKFSFSLPPLPKQRAIARMLRAVQAARAARQREASLERERKAALMDYLFTHGTRGEATKQTPIGEMPESWEVVELANLVRKTITDGVHQTPQYVADHGVPFITAKDIVGSRIDFQNSSRISSKAHYHLTQRVRPERGDVLLTKVGTVGKVALIADDEEFSIFVQVALIKPLTSRVDSRFLFYALQSQGMQSEIYTRSALSTMRFIGTQKIASLRTPLPDLIQQASIADVLQASDAKIAALDRESALLDELFRALLEELMSGRVAVAKLLDESS